MRYSIPLTANEPRTIECPGAKVLQIVDTGVAQSVTLTLIDNLGQRESLGAVRDDFRGKVVSGFSGFEVQATVATTVDVIVSRMELDAVFGQQPYTVGEGVGVGVLNLANTPILSANANRKEFRLRNTSSAHAVLLATDDILAGGGIRAIRVEPLDTWIEDKIAHMAWYGLCEDAAQTSIVWVQELFQ